ncbi:L-serine ammonia-lyase [Apiospora arundinis]
MRQFAAICIAILCTAAQAEPLNFPTPTEPPQSELSGEPLAQNNDGVLPMPSITAPPSVPELQSHATRPDEEELRKRQADVSYLTQIGMTSYIGQFPWPNPSTGPSWETATCQSGATFAVRGGYGACCHPTAADCQFPTGCAGPNVVGPNGQNGACPAGWTCQDAVVLQSKGSPDVNTYLMCKSGAYSSRVTWYRNRFAFPPTSTAVVVVDQTSVVVHSVTSTRKRTTTTNDQSVATDAAPPPPPGPLRDPFKDSTPRAVKHMGLQGLIAVAANILYAWA